MWQRLFSTKNLHAALIYRLLIILFLFTVCRILFYIFNNQFFVINNVFDFLVLLIAGLRFDLSAVIVINGIFLALYLLPLPFRTHYVYQGFTDALFYVVNSLALLANCIDLAYFPYTLKRTTIDVINFLSIGNGGDFFRLLPNYLIDFWYIFFIWSLLTGLMVFLYRKTKKGYFVIGNKLVYYLKNTAYLIIGAVLWVVIGRGGIQLRPLGIISAGEYASAQNIPVVLNTPFTLIQTFDNEQLEIIKYFNTQKEIDRIYNPSHNYIKPADSIKKINVVIIILEGFSKEHMGYLNSGIVEKNYRGYCPFLDSLSQEGLNFTNAFSNGKKSIEGIPAVIAGLPNLMERPYITSSYAGNPVNGLPMLLKKQGYSSAFFHGGTNGTMQFDAFSSLAGFDKYYGRTEYNNDADFDGRWGIYDEEFLQFTAQKINSFNQPFIAAIFTLSSHHPYKIPEKYKGRFTSGRLDIHESIGYADYSLKKFFETLSRMPWYKNTLFVITSDHSSPTFTEYYQNSLGNLAIPMIYYRPDGSLKGQDQTITQQSDILPSVIDYLGNSNEFIAYGESVFDKKSKHFSICYFNNVYQLIYNNMMLQFNGEKTLAVYNITDDHLLKNNLVTTSKCDYSEAEKLIKAIVQSYGTRMNGNELIIKP